MKNLVIVESPAKAKTIGKFLGEDYTVMSSHGHIRDLSRKGVDMSQQGPIEPIYEVSDDKTQLVRELKRAAKQAQTIWLASDEDREGEAIAWHLYEELGLKGRDVRRIVFHEITKPAIVHALENPRDIDLDLVNAQQARRVLDRVVGFELSPVLWRKVRPALSAGRVQSVAVRLIADREREIKDFRPQSYFRATAVFRTPQGQSVRAEAPGRLSDAEAARRMLSECAQASFEVADIAVKPVKKAPAPPFTTSTLQQEAARKLGFPVSLTMQLAQKLYEAGHITYMRTDSLNLSPLAVEAMAKLITDELGPEYVHRRRYHTSTKGAQEAHEAIRPTYVDQEKAGDDERQRKLYRLIRQRALASQMADAELERTTVRISPTGAGPKDEPRFTAEGEVIKFDGFLRMYLEGTDDDSTAQAEGRLPRMTLGEPLQALTVTATERFTLAPPRYTEASLVKKMEELGIGRPSTYAPTISTIMTRGYVARGEKEGQPRDYQVLTLDAHGRITDQTATENSGSDRGKLVPTDTGMVVNDFLTQNFPDILDYEFTAGMEQKFDRIAQGHNDWNEELRGFYDLFHPEVEKAINTQSEHRVGERMLGQEPGSGHPVSVKIGRFGPMVQIGSGEGEEKPRFASLRPGQSIYDITLEEALKLFDLPRTLGQYEDKDVVVAVGRFGPYVRHDGKFTSIPKDMSPTTLALEQAIELIEAKREADAKKFIKGFAEAPEIQILQGRWGPYIKNGKDNVKIPKTVESPRELTLEQVRELIATQPEKKARKKKG